MRSWLLYLLPLELFLVFDAETANPFLSGFSIYRVAFGYLPNPRLRCRHLKFPLRLLPLRRTLPPRWRRPRLGENVYSRARVSYTCARRPRTGSAFFLLLKRKAEITKRYEQDEEEKKRFGHLFRFVEMIR